MLKILAKFDTNSNNPDESVIKIVYKVCRVQDTENGTCLYSYSLICATCQKDCLSTVLCRQYAYVVTSYNNCELLKPRLHDTTSCQTGLYNRIDNWFDNTLYRVNGALQWRLQSLGISLVWSCLCWRVCEYRRDSSECGRMVKVTVCYVTHRSE